MLKLHFILLSALMVGSLTLSAQNKKPLDHSVYDSWKNTGTLAVTPNGNYGFAQVSAQEGDGYLALFTFGKNLQRTDTIGRGSSAAFTPDQNYVVYTIKAPYAETKKATKDHKDAPKDSVEIRHLKTGAIIPVSNATGFKVPEEGSNLVAVNTQLFSKDNKSAKRSRLLLIDPVTRRTDTIIGVTGYAFNKNGSLLSLVCEQDTVSHTQAGIYLYHTQTGQMDTLYAGHKKSVYTLPVFNKESTCAAYILDRDTLELPQPLHAEVYVYSLEDQKNVCWADSNCTNLPEGWCISTNTRNLAFSDDNARLFYSIAPILPQKDTSDHTERATLDIWHYNDEYLQPAQLKRVEEYRNQTYLVTAASPGHLTRIATTDYENANVPNNFNARWAYAAADKPYRIASQWKEDQVVDLYIIPLTGEQPKMIAKELTMGSLQASPDGNYLVWFDAGAQHWYAYIHATGQIRCLTEHLGVAFGNELTDTPSARNPYGNGGWLKDDKAVLLYDRYDIWQVDPTGKNEPFILTRGIGRQHEITLRVTRMETTPQNSRDRRTEPIDPSKPLYLSAFDNNTKMHGFYSLSLIGKKNAQPVCMVMDGHTYTNALKAKDADVFLFSRNNYTESPNVYVTRNAFRTQEQLTDINPQQNGYNWGTAELVHWTTATGRPCDGILYKPQDFDPNKKYPLLIYFYERLSDDLYAYKQPAPSRSTINLTFYPSNGYLVFTPDIYYRTGHPGQSAMECIMPGVDMLCQNPWVDSDNMAIQGQSWGGYQVAYMVTQTQRFKAAWAGAPVSNMTSAYGGIRWGSGVTRQMQYENGQSRIGTTLWDGFDLYVENSPLFFAPNVTTPLVIMHNDNDGAVPWYQGIEYFTGLRRLGKQVWLLQYNGEEHNLSQRVNAKDLSMRLQQFFDHFLKGKDAAPWIEHGVPAYKKGIDWGFPSEN